MTLKDTVQIARPGHWVKNLFVLFPVIPALRIHDTYAWLSAGIAAAAFCLVASAGYIFNDIRDRVSDRLHPRKKDRPLAAGRVTARAAGVEAAVLLALGVAAAATVNVVVLSIVLAYVVLQAAYSAWLKQRMLVDVICIAMGFVLRAVAGAAAIPVAISPWLFVCTFTICLFLGFCKRCNEVVTLRGSAPAGDHRRTLARYTPELLTHLITLSGAVAVVAFLLYATNVRTIQHFGTDYLVYTLPLVIYGVFRFAMLSMAGRYADPTDLILHDRMFQLALVAWTNAAILVIRWGPGIRDWLARL